MNCPYCNTEMEVGRLVIESIRFPALLIKQWVAESEYKKTGLAALKRKVIKLHNGYDGFHRSQMCPKCQKVFGEFDIN